MSDLSAAGVDVQLQSGDRVLWQGRPEVRDMWLLPAIVLLSIFLRLAIVFIALSAAVPPTRGEPPIALLVLLPFVFTLAILVPVFAVFWREIARNRYFLTDRRAIFHGPSREAQIDLAQLPYLEILRGRLGRSTILFGPAPFAGAWAWSRYACGIPAFRSIADGDRVYQLINEARARLRPA